MKLRISNRNERIKLSYRLNEKRSFKKTWKRSNDSWMNLRKRGDRKLLILKLKLKLWPVSWSMRMSRLRTSRMLIEQQMNEPKSRSRRYMTLRGWLRSWRKIMKHKYMNSTSSSRTKHEWHRSSKLDSMICQHSLHELKQTRKKLCSSFTESTSPTRTSSSDMTSWSPTHLSYVQKLSDWLTSEMVKRTWLRNTASNHRNVPLKCNVSKRSSNIESRRRVRSLRVTLSETWMTSCVKSMKPWAKSTKTWNTIMSRSLVSWFRSETRK